MSGGYLADEYCEKCGVDQHRTRLRFEHGGSGDKLCITCGHRVYDRSPVRLIETPIDHGMSGSQLVRDRMEDLSIGAAVEVPLIPWVEPITLRTAAKKQASQQGIQVLIENFDDAFLIHRLR